MLGKLKDDELDAASLREGWTRRHLIAFAGYHARALAQRVATARAGTGLQGQASELIRPEEIELGATLPARALRGLVFHATIHLDVEWRDLTDDQWETPLFSADGTSITIRDTPLLRAKTIWQCAVDLGNGGRVADIPAEVRRAG